MRTSVVKQNPDFEICGVSAGQGVEPVRIFFGQGRGRSIFLQFCADIVYGRPYKWFCFLFSSDANVTESVGSNSVLQNLFKQRESRLNQQVIFVCFTFIIVLIWSVILSKKQWRHGTVFEVNCHPSSALTRFTPNLSNSNLNIKQES